VSYLFHLTPTATFNFILTQQVLVQSFQFVNRIFGEAFGPGAREVLNYVTEMNHFWDGILRLILNFAGEYKYTPEADIEEPWCPFLSRKMCAFQ